MIKKVILHNFESHKHTELNFSEGINMFSGSSDSGKSGIMRAMNWVVYNEPRGDGMVSFWALNEKGNQIEDTYVTMEFDDFTVTRYRGKEGNNYKLTNSRFPDTITMDAIGSGVPEEISSLVNFNEVNLQLQMEPLFLLSSSPGKVAQFFNKIVHLDTIDKSMSLIKSKKKKTKDDLETVQKNKELTEEELEQYVNLDRIESLIAEIEKLEASTLDDEIQKIQATIEEYEKLTTFLSEIDTTISEATRIVKEIQAIPSIDTTTLQCQIESYERYTKAISDLAFLDRASVLVGKISRYAEMSKAATAEIEKVSTQVATATQCQTFLESYEEAHEKLHSQLPDNCPYCHAENVKERV